MGKHLSIGIECDFICPHPRGAKHTQVYPHLFLEIRGQVAHGELVFHPHPHQQAHADVRPQVSKTVTGLGDVDLRGIGVRAFHVGASLTEDETAHVMRVTGAHAGDAMPVIE